jgi:hypothetical protein
MEPNPSISVLEEAQASARRGRVRCKIGSNQREVLMDKKLVGAIGAIAGLATLDTTAQAAPAATPAQPQGARSFAELLDPIPNAVAALRAADAAAVAAREQGVQDPAGEVQVAGWRRHHHHHHRYRHHHHHHHHHRAVIVLPGVRLGIGHRHHHHHHHHHY